MFTHPDLGLAMANDRHRELVAEADRERLLATFRRPWRARRRPQAAPTHSRDVATTAPTRGTREVAAAAPTHSRDVATTAPTRGTREAAAAAPTPGRDVATTAPTHSRDGAKAAPVRGQPAGTLASCEPSVAVPAR